MSKHPATKKKQLSKSRRRALVRVLAAEIQRQRKQMKALGPLRSSLSRRSQLQRRVAMLRGSTPLARCRLRPIGRKKRRQSKARRQCKLVLIDRSEGACEARIKGVCTGQAEHPHELRRQGQGGSATDPANCLAVCAACHDFINRNPKRARKLGLHLFRGDVAGQEVRR